MESISLRPEQQRRVGRPDAAATCFDWTPKQVVEEESAGSEAMNARKRGIRQSAITATLAAGLYYFISNDIGTVVFGVAGVLLVTSLLTPLSIYAGIEHFVAWIASRLEKGVTWLLMRLIFHLLFAPFGKLFRSGMRDSLKRTIEPERESYWNQRSSEPVTAESRKRLY